LIDNLVGSLDRQGASVDASEQQRIRELLLNAARGDVRSPGPVLGRRPLEYHALPRTAASESPSDLRPVSEPAAPSRPPEAAPPIFAEKHLSAETVRVPVGKLDSLLMQIEELIAAKLTIQQQVFYVKEMKEMVEKWTDHWSNIQPEYRELVRMAESEVHEQDRGGRRQSASRIKEFLEANCELVSSLGQRLRVMKKSNEDNYRSVGVMVDALLDDMKNVLMFPFSSLLVLFPKLVRDLSRELGKEISIEIRGGEIEIDKRILQELKDPLIHIIRNSIDHGIEEPAVRIGKHKSAAGNILIAVSQKDSGNVEVLIADDGTGIDTQKVKSSAANIGVMSHDEAGNMNNAEALDLVFRSGVSTSPIITNISGRGLGLAIVREKVEKLGGSVRIETRPDQGTAFLLLLPLTLATFRGILVEVGDQIFALPTMQVEKIQTLRKDAVRTVENKETIQFSGRTISFVRLEDLLELPIRERKDDAAGVRQAVVLGKPGSEIAFGVDEILNEEEILVKPLGRQLCRVRNIAGATVLGTGRVVLILNTADMMKTAVKANIGAKRIAVSSSAASSAKRSILIVEDSITSRTLIKNILESAGYEVTTAIDGYDGFAALQERTFDLVVSDIQMPRLNGLDLTEKIRSDERFGGLPVVLVTSMSTPEDRQRGIDVGADAYIVKSSFDQSNLLETIKRLL
ncbi:MAG: response regulator, partial [Deltaproteobacteria bacterium]